MLRHIRLLDARCTKLKLPEFSVFRVSANEGLVAHRLGAARQSMQLPMKRSFSRSGSKNWLERKKSGRKKNERPREKLKRLRKSNGRWS